MATLQTLTIGDREFKFSKLTIGQIEDILPLLGETISKSADGKSGLNSAKVREILALALKRHDPEITADTFREVEGTFADLLAAMNTILAASGFTFAKAGDGTGEAQAPQGSTSTKSSAPSLQDADSRPIRSVN